LTAHHFGTLPDGKSVEIFSIRSESIELRAISYGAIITSLRVPDRNGHVADVVLGHDMLDPYIENPAYLGAVVGRYANRIALGRFQLDGVTHRLATNDGANHLHGGTCGFSRRLWTASPVSTRDATGVRFTRTSEAGEERYPGTLHLSVTYLVSPGQVALHYEATTDAPTIVNLTQHSYFNLGGETSSSVLDHELTVHADAYTPVGAGLIPTGEFAPVANTPFDFRQPARIGDRIQRHHEQLRIAGGFDHNFILSRRESTTPVAELRHPSSGRTLRVVTSEPGLQFYGGHLLDRSCTDAYGRTLGASAGMCLETQHYPDSPNHPSFPSVTLREGQTYESTTLWEFHAN
jgi:aldose 1-epimerase